MSNDTCSVDGCDRPARKKGWCDSHRWRVKQYGEPGPAEFRGGGRKIHSDCIVIGCDEYPHGKGLCRLHYRRWIDGRDIGPTVAELPEREMRRCVVSGCGRHVQHLGYCSGHYQRLRKNGSLGDTKIADDKDRPEECQVDGCTRKNHGRGYCSMHRQRLYETGELGGPLLKRRPNGSVRPDGQGYLLRTVEGRQVKEHRHLMEKMLGRRLTSKESVHHVDGQRDNNTITGELDDNYRSGNLELWSKSQPAGQRVVDKVAFAVDLLSLYAPHLLADPSGCTD